MKSYRPPSAFRCIFVWQHCNVCIHCTMLSGSAAGWFSVCL